MPLPRTPFAVFLAAALPTLLACAAPALSSSPALTTAFPAPGAQAELVAGATAAGSNAPAATTASSAAAAPPVDAAPSLDQVVKEASLAHTPVLLDFGAVWCQPCAELAKKLAKPEAASSLAAYRVQTYDIEDGGAGTAASEHFGVHELPTLIVLGPDGAEIDRGDADGGVLAWLDARAKIAARGALTDQRLAGESDPLALLLGAHAAERGHEDARAERLLAAAHAADPKDDRGIASEAAFELLRYRSRGDAQRDHGALLLGFALAYPRSSFALRALDGISALPADARPAAAELARAVRATRDAEAADHDVGAAHLARIEYALGLSTTAPPVITVSGWPLPAPRDPLADAPAAASGPDRSAPPPEIQAMFQRDMAVGGRLGKACKDAPRAAGVKSEYCASGSTTAP